jgi:hypothetical protein
MKRGVGGLCGIQAGNHQKAQQDGQMMRTHEGDLAFIKNGELRRESNELFDNPLVKSRAMTYAEINKRDLFCNSVRHVSTRF